MSIERNKNKTQMLAMTAMFAAIIAVLQLFIVIPPIGAAYITLSLVPIVLGAVLYGPLNGAILGLVLGLCVVYQVVFTPDPFSATMFQLLPVVTIVLCLLKTTIAGLVSGLVYKLLSKKNKTVAVFTASALCPIVNTGLYLAGVLVFFGDLVSGAASGAGKTVIMFIVSGVILTNFIPELIVNMVLAPVIIRVSEITSKLIKR
ncbi:MAG: ECF transporter S component [Clostridia bacterium]|nr:ECF transporter S component [Clostridia bacterium]